MASRRLNIVLDLDTGGYSGRLATASGQMRNFGGQVSSTSRSVQAMGGSFERLGQVMSTPTQRLRDYVLILGNLRLALLNVRDIAVSWIAGLIKQSAEVERLTVLMRGMSTATTDFGKNKEATENLSRLYEMARRNGMGMRELTDAFVKFKSAGIDPLNGSLNSLTNAVSYLGGTSETMHRASIAIQQMAGKGVVSMEELRQQLGEAVPTAMSDMARAAGMTMPEFANTVKKGIVQAGPALELMFREFTLKYEGAGERIANTLNGQLAQFSTNVTELATYFTGMAQGNTAAFQNYIGEQRKLLEDNKISQAEFEENTRPQAGLFTQATESLKELNALMRSPDGRRAMESLGQIFGSITSTLASGIRFIIEWRDQIVFAATVAGKAFLVLKAVDIARWFTSLGIATFEAIRNMKLLGSTMLGNAFIGGADFLKGKVQAVERLNAISAIRVQRLGAESAADTRNVLGLKKQSASLRVLSADYAQNLQIITRHRAASEAALATGAKTGRFRDYETGTFISQSRAIEINKDLIAAGARNRAALANVTRELTAVETQLTATLGQQTARQAELAVATTAQATAQGIATRAAALGAVAARGLGMAVNAALGPLGLIAFALYAAADAAGVFENKALKATEAAYKLMQGIADADLLKRTVDRKASNDKVIKDAEFFGDRVSPMRKAEADRARKENVMLEAAIKRGEKSLAFERGKNNGQIYGADRADFRKPIAEQYNNDSRAYDRGELSKAELDKRRERAQKLEADYDKGIMSRLEARRDGLRKANKDTSEIDGRIEHYRTLSGATNELSQSTEQLRGSLIGAAKDGGASGAGASKAGKEAKAAAKEFDNARDKYGRMLGEQDGRIAELKANLAGGNGELEKFQAKAKAGLFPKSTQGEIDALAKGFAEIDRLESQIAFNQSIKRLAKDLSRATAESDALWASLKNGTWDKDQRANQVRSQFADKLEGVSDPAKIAEVNRQIDAVVEKLNSADAAKIAYDWQQSTVQILNGLMTEDAARNANYESEIARQRALVDLTVAGTRQRQQAEAAFNGYVAALRKKQARENESSVIKMARDWSRLGQNMDQALSGAMSNFVNSLAEGKLAFGDFVKEMLLALVKVIIQAIIAYAILSALGMAPSGGLGNFIKGGIADFGKGFGGTPTGSASGEYGGRVTAPVFSTSVPSGATPGFGDEVNRFHTGGWFGSNPLKDGEVPLVGLEKEAALTEHQQRFYGKAFEAAIGGGAPNVEVNIINNSGTQLEAEKGQPEFNGKDMIVNVIVEAAQKDGPLRNTLQSFGKR